MISNYTDSDSTRHRFDYLWCITSASFVDDNEDFVEYAAACNLLLTSLDGKH